MSSVLVVCLLFSSAFAIEQCTGNDCDDTESIQVKLLQTRVQHEEKFHVKQTPPLGNSACPCVGIANVNGTLDVAIGGQTVKYPRSMASECKAWDEGVYPGSCDGANPASWCSTAWCYVDPCDCDATAIGSAPKKSSYFPNGMYKGRELYYSYATCDGADTYTDATVAANDLARIADICALTVSESVYGKSECRCIGVSGRPGETTVTIGGTNYQYPASYGTTCSANDNNLTPDCDAADPTARPSWCSSSWCYVDPCDCNMQPLPKYTSYIAGSTVKGVKVYYSYATCSGTDTYTAAATATADQLAIPGICGTR